MFLELDMNSEIPIYIQIKDQIIFLIAKNDLREGDKLPSVRQLATDIGVNLHTINKAYNLLKDDGFLVVNRRKGVLVSSVDQYLYNETYLEQLNNLLKPIIVEAVARKLPQDKIGEIVKNLISESKGSADSE